MYRFLIALVVIVSAPLCERAVGQGDLAGPSAPYSDLIKRPSIKSALEMADYQSAEMEKLLLSRRVIMSQAFHGIDVLAAEERKARMKTMQEELLEIEKQIYQVLLPFQRLRIDQIRNQELVRASDATAGLTHHRMVSALGLTEAQLKEVREKAAMVDKKLQEKLAEFRKLIELEKSKARQEVLMLLTDEQRKNYHAILGDPIDGEEGKPLTPQPLVIPDRPK